MKEVRNKVFTYEAVQWDGENIALVKETLGWLVENQVSFFYDPTNEDPNLTFAVQKVWVEDTDWLVVDIEGRIQIFSNDHFRQVFDSE